MTVIYVFQEISMQWTVNPKEMYPKKLKDLGKND